jgi:hypothetical protein
LKYSEYVLSDVDGNGDKNTQKMYLFVARLRRLKCSGKSYTIIRGVYTSKVNHSKYEYRGTIITNHS